MHANNELFNHNVCHNSQHSQPPKPIKEEEKESFVCFNFKLTQSQNELQAE